MSPESKLYLHDLRSDSRCKQLLDELSGEDMPYVPEYRLSDEQSDAGQEARWKYESGKKHGYILALNILGANL